MPKSADGHVMPRTQYSRMALVRDGTHSSSRLGASQAPRPQPRTCVRSVCPGAHPCTICLSERAPAYDGVATICDMPSTCRACAGLICLSGAFVGAPEAAPLASPKAGTTAGVLRSGGTAGCKQRDVLFCMSTRTNSVLCDRRGLRQSQPGALVSMEEAPAGGSSKLRPRALRHLTQGGREHA
jgi:hypothetical protein